MTGNPDEVFFLRKRGSVGMVNQRITFDASCDIPATVGIDPIGASPAPHLTRHDDGAVTLTAAYGRDLPGKAGYRLHIPRA
jgi:hypothetical protein